MDKKKEILILGCGPTGLGAAWRANEIGYNKWNLLESMSYPGGLASSFIDQNGFTWDIGGHVQFSHYEYFDRVMDELLSQDDWIYHDRESWIWMRDRFIPYPLQNNIHRLPREDLDRCLQGLLDLPDKKNKPNNFRSWILDSFGKGIADIFLFPYNFKVWAYPPELLNTVWVGERVARTDLKRVLHNLVYNIDDIGWGPNNKFKYPLSGGTGAIWKACSQKLPQNKLHFDNPVVNIDLENHTVTMQTGSVFKYDKLISTLPLTELLTLSGQFRYSELTKRGLLYSSSNIVGVGLKGHLPKDLQNKCWIYFPEDNCPFYRVTVFSNYSPNNVPNAEQYWSLMAEVSESPVKNVDHNNLEESVIQGLLNIGFISKREEIVSTWKYNAKYGYPTPGLQRDKALSEILPFFEKRDVFPRGRFGMWKYEVSNQDHSFMQGVEIIDRLVNDRLEMTINDPTSINGNKQSWPYID